MNRRAILGLCMLCALVISAVAAQGAFANTAFVCSASAATRDFSDAHCKTKATPQSNFGHHELPLETAQAISATNITTGTERSPAKLHSVQSGVELELEAQKVSSTEGTMQNKESGAEMWAEGSGKLIYEEVTVTKPSGKGCKVSTATITTKKLTATTKGLAANRLNFKPVGENFAEFTVEGCGIAALNHAYTVTGSVTGTTEGATTTTTREGSTTEGTLKLQGQKAGIAGSITISTSEGGLALT